MPDFSPMNLSQSRQNRIAQFSQFDIHMSSVVTRALSYDQFSRYQFIEIAHRGVMFDLQAFA